MNDRGRRVRLAAPVWEFLQTEIAGGVVLLLAATAALVWANSPWDGSYASLWHTELSLELGGGTLTHDLRHWVNDGLMTLFFFVVGLEVKHELVAGELRDRRQAALPVLAALGGMVVPALLYALGNAGGDGSPGWGIPMATDIAFALGVVALLGRRVPTSLKVFLLTLAVVDDIGAIVVIAVFYAGGVEWQALAVAAGLLALIVVLRRLGVWWHPLYVALGVGLWLATFQSGVHATIAGVAMGLVTPVPLTARVQHLLHPWTSFAVVPLFALANAGIVLDVDVVQDAASSPVTIGVVLGLVVGKLVGITGFAWLAVRLRLGALPAGVTWLQLAGIAAVAGVGFTVAIFVAGLAFDAPALQAEAKVGILAASLLASLLGAGLLSLAGRDVVPPQEEQTA